MREQLEQWIERIGGRRRATALGVGVGAVLLILGASWWATAPEWVPMATNLPLESVGEVTSRLESAKIDHRLSSEGTTIEVASSDLARARVAVAQEGSLPSSGRPGLELFDQPSWGMTDFTQRINYRRALEGELERTIGRMRGVEAAQVHLAIQEASGFRRAEGPSEASVVLQLSGGTEPDPAVVQGVQHLVASSVGGLQSTNVMVLDDAGRLLSAPNDEGGTAVLTHRQLAMQREVETHLRRKVEQLLARVVGVGNASVEVSAQVNFDRVERTLETMDPDGQVLASEQLSEIVPGAEGGAGSRTNAATYENSRRLETFSGSVGGLERVSVAVLIGDREVVGADGAVTYETWPPEELQSLQTLVRSAIGYDVERGDEVSVVSMPFTRTQLEEPAMDVWSLIERLQRPVLSLLALLLTFVVAMRLIRTLRQPEAGELPAPAAKPALDEAEALGALPAAGAPAAEAPAVRAPVVAEPIEPAAPTRRDIVEELVARQPAVSARLIRTWLREDDS